MKFRNQVSLVIGENIINLPFQTCLWTWLDAAYFLAAKNGSKFDRSLYSPGGISLSSHLISFFCCFSSSSGDSGRKRRANSGQALRVVQHDLAVVHCATRPHDGLRRLVDPRRQTAQPRLNQRRDQVSLFSDCEPEQRSGAKAWPASGIDTPHVIVFLRRVAFCCRGTDCVQWLRPHPGDSIKWKAT